MAEWCVGCVCTTWARGRFHTDFHTTWLVVQVKEVMWTVAESSWHCISVLRVKWHVFEGRSFVLPGGPNLVNEPMMKEELWSISCIRGAHDSMDIAMDCIMEVTAHKCVPIVKLRHSKSLIHGHRSTIRNCPTETAIEGIRVSRRCENPIPITEQPVGDRISITTKSTLISPDNGILPCLRFHTPVPVRNSDIAINLPEDILQGEDEPAVPREEVGLVVYSRTKLQLMDFYQLVVALLPGISGGCNIYNLDVFAALKLSKRVPLLPDSAAVHKLAISASASSVAAVILCTIPCTGL